jgi:hypothetical protein
MTKEFDYTRLLNEISGIEIKLEGDEVATYYNNRQVSRKKVSTKYEIFDFKPFVIQCIDSVIEKYDIEKYELTLTGGRQEIRLFSYPEVINGEEFRKTFYLLNSSDKSRALSFSYGLKHMGFHYISTSGAIYKKHYTGITKYVEDRVDLDDSVFTEQIEILKDLIGSPIHMSNVQKVITESEVLSESKVTFRNNFDNFRRRLYDNTYNNTDISEEDRKKLYVNYWNRVKSVDFCLPENDFIVDSFLVFRTYLELFNKRDAQIIKNESKRISNLTIIGQRESNIDELLNSL